MNIENYLKNRQQRINAFLFKNLPQNADPQDLHSAMHYAVLNGGKRIRPLLVYATGEVFGADLDLLDYPACAIELIHAYSLVHDDLPAMDNDDLRRGKPTCHIAFDEPTAILVGDALQTLAFHILSEPSNHLTADTRLAMIHCLSYASGSFGMAGGQALDLKATGKKLTQTELSRIHHLKTGTLIAASVQLGLLAAGINDKRIISSLIEFATHIGLCFQIKDDILNSEGETNIIGKKAGTDEVKHKATYTTLEGIAGAKEKLDLFYNGAIQSLDSLEYDTQILRFLAKYIVMRDY